ncbi:sulfite exporter TauE/SafE family protein [Pseudorhodobacter ferrugineus]|uniref:sulfite exporter TauE/SafE family protein n=1 Tax=Pseudorhodobacter ferrugineus TaxID=77008 RepID=UPI0003B59FDF|nr:sulfite exporter TauE/SafE family protein [Pseudorhodobacter ferrugineus]
MYLPFDLTPLTAAYMAVVLFGAAFVRGYSGFGFAALTVTGASLVTSPLHMVGVVLILDFLMIFQQWTGISRDVDWRRVGPLVAGAAVGVPIGLWAITQVPPDAARAVMAVYVLVMCAVLLRGFVISRPQGVGHHGGMGVISGLANAVGMGGLPVATYFTAQGLGARGFRATLIAYFALLDGVTVPLMWWHGLIGWDTLVAVAGGLPIVVLGAWLGGRHFFGTDPQEFRRFAIGLLAVLAVLALIKAAV